MLAVYRIGGHIPTPGINSEALVRLFERALALSPRLAGGTVAALVLAVALLDNGAWLSSLAAPAVDGARDAGDPASGRGGQEVD